MSAERRGKLSKKVEHDGQHCRLQCLPRLAAATSYTRSGGRGPELRPHPGYHAHTHVLTLITASAVAALHQGAPGQTTWLAVDPSAGFFKIQIWLAEKNF